MKMRQIVTCVLACVFLALTLSGGGVPRTSALTVSSFQHWANLYFVDSSYGAYNDNFQPAVVRLARDGGLAIGLTGSGNSASWYAEMMTVLRLDPYGRVLWVAAPLTCGDGGMCTVKSLAFLSDGRIAVLATYVDTWESTEGYVVVALLGANGSFQWMKTFLGRFESTGYYDLQATKDGGMLVAAALAQGHWVARLASTGRITWQARLDASIFSLKPTPDGGFIAVGVSGGELGSASTDAWIAKFTAVGAISWQTALGDPAAADEFHQVVVVPDGYTAAGETSGLGASGQNIWVVKFDLSGQVLWHRAFGRPDARHINTTASLTGLRSGAYLLCGYSGPDAESWHADYGFALKIASSGSPVWAREFPSAIADGIELGSGDFVVTGRQLFGGTCWPIGNAGQDYIFAARLDSLGLVGANCCLVGGADIFSLRNSAAIPYVTRYATIHSPATVRNLAPTNVGYQPNSTTVVCQADAK